MERRKSQEVQSLNQLKKMNVQPHIKELYRLINQKEADLFNRVEKWKSTQTGELYTWQTKLCNDFLKEKALIKTICESWIDIQMIKDKQSENLKLDAAIGETRVFLLNTYLRDSFEPVLKWLIQIEKNEATPEQKAVYDLISKVMDLAETTTKTKPFFQQLPVSKHD